MKNQELNFQVQFERLAEAMSPSAALHLCAFFGPGSLYVPPTIPESHPIFSVIGKDASDALAFELGGQTLKIPSAELVNVRRAGKVFSLMRHGLSKLQISRALNLSMRRVDQIMRELKGLHFDC
jgi:hypothetical protein